VGVVKQINKLISVIPMKSKYVGEIGDVVVGRVTEIQKKRWKIDTNSRLDSVLLISSINLPGGELRRRNAEDEQAMRKLLQVYNFQTSSSQRNWLKIWFQEEDLLSAEVQNVFIDGSLSLHTRSLKYGKLSQGILVAVSPSLIKRRKTHFHNLPCGVSVIIGNNGYVWVSPTVNVEVEGQGGFTQNLEAIAKSDRETIVRIKNCILALSSCFVMIYDTSIMLAYEESLKYEVKELLNQEIMHEVGFNAKQRLLMEHE
jgi:exosome complex component RRP4